MIVDPEGAMVQGKIYIVKMGNEFVARHLHVEDGHFRLKASNGAYEDLRVAGVQLIGRVVWHIRRMQA